MTSPNNITIYMGVYNIFLPPRPRHVYKIAELKVTHYYYYAKIQRLDPKCPLLRGSSFQDTVFLKFLVIAKHD